MVKFYFFLLSTAFISCTSTRLNYLGSSYSPTQKVDVFVDASAIQRPFTVIGKSSVEIIRLSANNFERLQKMALQKAKEKGANAILFQDLYVTENGGSIQTVSRPDSSVKSSLNIRTGIVGPIVSSRKDVLYLKYD
jgi:hypothetical protein